jgi:hypothetical protein
VLQHLDRLLEEAEGSNKKAVPAALNKRLSDTMSPLEWRKRRGNLVELCLRAHSYRPRHFGQRLRGIPLDYSTIGEGVWAEVAMSGPILRMKGRADVVEKRGHLVRITDLKTGRIWDAPSAPEQTAAKQLRIYGLIALEIEPQASISLHIVGSTEQEVPFNPSAREAMLTQITEFTERFPAGAVIESGGIACPGSDCFYCARRHVCQTYLQRAPELWNVGSGSRLPADIWGTVVERGQDGVGTTLRIIDAAGRRAKVSGLDSRAVDRVNTGDQLWMFNLQPAGSGWRMSTWFHPTNFYYRREGDAPWLRAWALDIFGG